MPSLVGSTIASRYHVVRLIGRGGMGEVYLAKHVHTGEQVAVKVLIGQSAAAKQTAERFKREMRAPGRIKSDHVVRVIDADVAPELDGALFLVMELLDGCDLDKPLKERGPYSPVEVAWIFGQVARGLEKAHALGIVHRDLKPENLFLHRKDEVGLILKILDFGIARITEPNQLSVEEAKLTNTGTILGTPMYLSPEQAKSELQQIGPASDIWALGMIAFELLTGQPYWKANSLTGLLGSIMFAPMPKVTEIASSLPAACNEWFARSCHRDPAKRWRSVSAQVEALGAALKVSQSQLKALEAPPSLCQAIERLRPKHEPNAGLAETVPDQGKLAVASTAKAPGFGHASATIGPTSRTIQKELLRRYWLPLTAASGVSIAMAYILLHRQTPVIEPRPIPIAVPSIAKPAQPDMSAPEVTANKRERPAAKPTAPAAVPKANSKLKTRKAAAPTHTTSGFEPEGR